MVNSFNPLDSIAQNPGEADQVQIHKIFTYSHDGTEGGYTFAHNKFYQREVCQIGVELQFPPALHARTIHVDNQIFTAEGIAFSPLYPNDSSVAPGCCLLRYSAGWSEPNHWPLGKYYYQVSVNGGPAQRVDFEVCEGYHESLPCDLQSVFLFSSDANAIPAYDQRHYGNIFYADSLQWVNFQAEFPAPGRTIQTFVRYRVCSPNQAWTSHLAYPMEVSASMTHLVTSLGWGSPGYWAPGTYTYEIAVGNGNPIHGTFEVRGTGSSRESGVASAPLF